MADQKLLSPSRLKEITEHRELSGFQSSAGALTYCKNIDDLLEERELLVGIVRKYGNHLPDCKTMLPYASGAKATHMPCSCGWREVLSLLKEQG